MNACSKCKQPCGLLDLRPAPSGRVPESLCPPCYARWAEFQLESFIEELHAVHEAAHPGDDKEVPPPEQLAACHWDACRRAGRLAQAQVLA